MTETGPEPQGEPAPPARLRPSSTCRQHVPGEPRAEDAIEDGKGNVVAYHIRCLTCGIILETRRAESR